MGLFSNLRRAQSTPSVEMTARHVITPAVFIMTVDGSVDESEIAQLSNACLFSPIFAPVPKERTVQMIIDILNDIQSRGPNDVLGDAIAQMSPSLRETSLAIAMRIALADGRLDESEREVLNVLSHNMGIAPEISEVMFKVVAILQRGPDV